MREQHHKREACARTIALGPDSIRLVVKIKRKSPAQGQTLQRFAGRIKGTKRKILSTRIKPNRLLQW